MNDILLGISAMKDARDEGVAEWVRQLDAHAPEWEEKHSSEEYVWPALCRAQVAKVCEWMEKHNTANYVEKYNGWPMQLDEEGWQALRAAGGVK